MTDVIISVFFDELDLSKNIFTIREKKTDAEEVYSEEEIPIIKEYLLKKDSLRYLGILLVFVTGLRVGELAALKPEDIRLKENSGTIHVCRTEVHYNEEKEPGKRKNVVRVQEFAKSEAGNRKIIVNSFAVQILRRIQELNADPKEFLFEENGKRIKIQGFSRALRQTCENLEIPFRPMHKIRKTYGTTKSERHTERLFLTIRFRRRLLLIRWGMRIYRQPGSIIFAIIKVKNIRLRK